MMPLAGCHSQTVNIIYQRQHYFKKIKSTGLQIKSEPFANIQNNTYKSGWD